jgi:hypothetical protein
MVKHASNKVQATGSNPSGANNNNKFRLSSKSIFLTYPKCPVRKEEALRQIKAKKPCKYVGVGHELHEDGTDHLHALVLYDEKFTTKLQNYFDLTEGSASYHGNYQGARNNNDVLKYIKKNGDFVEEGEFVSNAQKDIQERALENKILLSKPVNELVDEGLIHLSHAKLIHQAKELYSKLTQTPNDSTNKICYWIYGTPGIGKSTFAFDKMYPGEAIYDKLINKWWDSYNNEDVVIIDDITPDHKGVMTYFLRRWADKRPFPGECKGGHTQQISFSRLVVTSNYLPKEIFAGDETTIEAIERRFKIVSIFKKSETERKLVDWPYQVQSYMEIQPIRPERKVRPRMEVLIERMAEAHQKYHQIDISKINEAVQIEKLQAEEKMAEEEEQVEEELKIDY